MGILVGVFSSEDQLNDALGGLFEHGVYETDVFLMRGEKAQVPMPALPNIARVEGDMADLRLTKEENERFRKLANDGNIICFVFTESDQMQAAMNILQIADEMENLHPDDY